MYSFKTFAKINLFLNVLKKQTDGYHQLDSIFVPVNSLYDEITLIPNDRLIIECNDIKVPQDEENLCWKAVEIFNQAINKNDKWLIKISKNIAVSGGLGGGSSNAAGILNFLNEFYEIALSKIELNKLAKKLGADVVFFLKTKPAIVQGIGEKITQIKLPNLHFIIVIVHFPILAKWAYDNLDIVKSKLEYSSAEILQKIQQKDFEPYNSLSFAIQQKFPLIKIIINEMKKINLKAQVNGSGSSLFALCESKEKLLKSIKKLKNNPFLSGVDFLEAEFINN